MGFVADMKAVIKRDASWVHKHRARACPERRAERRLLCSDLMQVRWTAPSGGRRCEMAVLEDFSGVGASLFLGVPVPPMTGVSLEAQARMLQGVVRYCSPQPNGYVVSVEFDRDIRREDYIPEHTLDIDRLDFSPEKN